MKDWLLGKLLGPFLVAFEKESGWASTAKKGDTAVVARSIVRGFRFMGRTFSFDLTARCTSEPGASP